MSRQTVAVLRKELTDHLRDRRSLTSALLFPVLGPLLFALTLSVLASWRRDEKPLELPVVGADRAPNLVAFLERHGAEVRAGPQDFEEAIRRSEVDVVVVIPDGYGEEFTAGRPASVQLAYDGARNRAALTVRRARRLLDAYASQVGYLRLLSRGINPELASALSVQELDVATPQQLASNLLNMIPLFILLTAFVGGMHVAIDSTAGERERGSLEALLINPVSRGALVAGKWLTVVAVSWLALAIALVGFAIAVRLVPMQDLGIRASFEAREILGILAAVLPLTWMSAAVQMGIATYARSFKEAQTYLSAVVLLPAVPGVFLSLSPVLPSSWMMLVPTLGQSLLVSEVMSGGDTPLGWFLLAAGCCLGVTVAALLGTSSLLGRERIVFGR